MHNSRLEYFFGNVGWDGGPMLDGTFSGGGIRKVHSEGERLSELLPSMIGYRFVISAGNGFHSSLSRKSVIERIQNSFEIPNIEADGIKHDVRKENGIILGVDIINTVPKNNFIVSFNSESNGTRVNWTENISFFDPQFGNVKLTVNEKNLMSKPEEKEKTLPYETISIFFEGQGPKTIDEMGELMQRIQSQHYDLMNFYGEIPATRTDFIPIDYAMCDTRETALEELLFSKIDDWMSSLSNNPPLREGASDSDYKVIISELIGKKTLQINIGNFTFYATRNREDTSWEALSLSSKDLDEVNAILRYEVGKKPAFAFNTGEVTGLQQAAAKMNNHISAFKAKVQNAIFGR